MRSPIISFPILLAAGSCSAAIAVIAGAFGAHALKTLLVPESLTLFETGARYQMYHALALVAVALAGMQENMGRTKSFQIAGWLFILGTVFFSGSLYLLALTDSRWLGMVTPFGGATLICGWVVLAWAALSGRGRPPDPV